MLFVRHGRGRRRHASRHLRTIGRSPGAVFGCTEQSLHWTWRLCSRACHQLHTQSATDFGSGAHCLGHGANVAESLQPGLHDGRWSCHRKLQLFVVGRWRLWQDVRLCQGAAANVPPILRRCWLHCGSPNTRCGSPAWARSQDLAQMGECEPEQWPQSTLTAFSQEQGRPD